MFYSLFSMIFDTIAGLFAGLLLLRFWMQIVRVRPPLQIAQFTFQLTDWMVKPMRRVIPGIGGFDWASLLGAYLIALICGVVRMWIVMSAYSNLAFIVALFTMLQWIIYGWTALLILEVVFSWINPQAPLAPFVRELNAPLLNPIRRVVPLLGGLDISPMVLFLLLQVASKALGYMSVSLVGALLV